MAVYWFLMKSKKFDMPFPDDDEPYPIPDPPPEKE